MNKSNSPNRQQELLNRYKRGLYKPGVFDNHPTGSLKTGIEPVELVFNYFKHLVSIRFNKV